VVVEVVVLKGIAHLDIKEQEEQEEHHLLSVELL
jgi:hypothetical protein